MTLFSQWPLEEIYNHCLYGAQLLASETFNGNLKEQDLWALWEVKIEWRDSRGVILCGE